MPHIAAIISEYNPFHSGHAYQITELRKILGEDTAVVAVMSGNFTQRAEAAIYDKYRRAAAALASGVDLVLELPFPYCSGSAEFFAAAGVRIAGAVGADTLVFGSEHGDLDALISAAEITRSDAYKNLLAAESPEKNGYAYAHAAALSKILGKDEEFVLQSNDILAIEYIRAILAAKETGDVESNLTPLTVKRIGSAYRESALTAEYASATAIRAAILSGDRDTACPGLPPASAAMIQENTPVKDEIVADTVFKIWRIADPDCMAQYAECGGGLAYRLSESARNAANAADFFASAASKNCTHVKLRRAAFFAVCGVTYQDLDTPVPYTIPLAFNARGREILHDAQRNSPIRILTKPADYRECSDEIRRCFALSGKADALYTTAMSPVPEAGYFLKGSPQVKK